MISKILFGILLSVGLGGYAFYAFVYVPLTTEVTRLYTLTTVQEIRNQTQLETVKALENNLVKTTESLNVLTKRNSEIEGEMSRYLDIFRRHNLTKLASAKPGLIEKRINKGTKDVFDSIENDSKFIDSIDN